MSLWAQVMRDSMTDQETFVEMMKKKKPNISIENIGQSGYSMVKLDCPYSLEVEFIFDKDGDFYIYYIREKE